jgi:hypothetical protein
MLHPNSKERDRLLNILFNLIKKPDDEQRYACNTFEKGSNCSAVHTYNNYMDTFGTFGNVPILGESLFQMMKEVC